MKGTVRTNSDTPLSLRAQPTLQSDRLARIPHKTAITLTCKALGTAVSNGKVASNVWNRVTYKKKTGYVASVYVTGGDSPQLSLCPAATSKTSTAPPSRPADVEKAIIAKARSQRKVVEKKNNCNPYGGCMPWASLFATWAWNEAGDIVPPFSFSGDLYAWGKKHNRAHDGTEGVGPGDMVLHGTGPDSPRTSTHVDIVIATQPDGKLRVIGGDIKGRVTERTVAVKGIYAWIDA